MGVIRAEIIPSKISSEGDEAMNTEKESKNIMTTVENLRVALPQNNDCI